MEDIFLIIFLIVIIFVGGIGFACANNEDNSFLVDEYEKILKKEFGQTFDDYNDYMLFKIKKYEEMVGGLVND